VESSKKTLNASENKMPKDGGGLGHSYGYAMNVISSEGGGKRKLTTGKKTSNGQPKVEGTRLKKKREVR